MPNEPAELLRERGLQVTAQRLAVLRAIEEAENEDQLQISRLVQAVRRLSQGTRGTPARGQEEAESPPPERVEPRRPGQSRPMDAGPGRGRHRNRFDVAGHRAGDGRGARSGGGKAPRRAGRVVQVGQGSPAFILCGPSVAGSGRRVFSTRAARGRHGFHINV